MNPKLLLTIALLCFVQIAFSAGFTSSSGVFAPEKSKKSYTLIELENLTGRKLSFFERLQFFMAGRQLKKAKKAGIFPERDELTEGFRPLAFFGSLFTLGLLFLIMLFTERDANALRWAQWGLWGAALVVLGLTVAYTISEGGY